MKRGLITILLLGLLVAGCAPEMKIYATKAAQLPVDEIDTLVVEPFVDQLGSQLQAPGGHGALKANQRLARLIKAEVLKGVSAGGDYRVAPGLEVQGTPLNLTKTGILRAKVRYYELNHFGRDQVFFVLLAKKQGLGTLESLAVAATAGAVARLAESQGKGFKVPVPYVEAAGAVEVEFDLIRASDHKTVIPRQTIRAYWHKKWGGDPDRSLLSVQLLQGFKAQGLADMNLLDQASQTAARLQLKNSDPEEYVAKGYHLKKNPMVPFNSLAIRSLLARDIGERFSRRISSYTIEVKLELASGDAVASNLIRGGAYNAAINRLESLPAPMDKGDLYNLGLSYEAMGQRMMAKRQYKKGLEQDPGNTRFKSALQRL